MSLAQRILWLGHRQVLVLLSDLELALSPPSWFAAYLKADIVKRELETHWHAVGEVIVVPLRQCHSDSLAQAERSAAHGDDEYLCGLLDTLVEAVHDRDADTAQRALDGLRTGLVDYQRAVEPMLVRVEARAGEVAAQLAKALSTSPAVQRAQKD